MIVNSWGISQRVASVVAHVWYKSHTIISVSPARVWQLCFEKLFCSEIKLAISSALESGQYTSGAINFGGASPGAAEKVAALVARATYSSGRNHDRLFFWDSDIVGCWLFAMISRFRESWKYNFMISWCKCWCKCVRMESGCAC